MANNLDTLKKLDIQPTNDPEFFSSKSKIEISKESPLSQPLNQILRNDPVNSQSLIDIITDETKTTLSSHELSKHAQDLFSQIQQKREKDSDVSIEFQKNISTWAKELPSKILELHTAECHSKSMIIEQKFNQISNHLENIARMETKLADLLNMVESFYQLTKQK